MTSVNEAVAKVKVTPSANRPALITEFFRGVVSPDSEEGRALLTRRALLMTKLREEKLWT